MSLFVCNIDCLCTKICQLGVQKHANSVIKMQKSQKHLHMSFIFSIFVADY